MAEQPRGLFAGLCTLDLVHRVVRVPGSDDKVTALSQELVAGGPAAVAALTFASLGGSARLVTGLGSHPLADVARRDLAEHGVMFCDLAEHDDPPPVSAVRVHDSSGARSVSSPDAAQVKSLVAPPELAEWVRHADVVLLDGHHHDLAAAVSAQAAAQLAPVVLDAGRWRPVFAELLPRAQFVVASAAFRLGSAGQVVAGTSAGPGTPADLPAVLGADAVLDRPEVLDLQAVLDLGVEAVAQSHGAGDIVWAVPGESGSVPVRPVTGGDTLSAGDVLHGAVAFAVAAVGGGAALARWPEVLRFAADVASVRVEHLGARAWLADPRPKEWARRWMY